MNPLEPTWPVGPALAAPAEEVAVADPEDDPRYVAALLEYAEAVESGRAVDRGAFLGRHSDLAPALIPALEGMDLLREAASLRDSAAQAWELTAPIGGAVDGELGDFRIIREVGRGGMGIVYEAVQLSLSRRVALKVLPAGAAMDRRLQMRFRTEVLAAAHLNHPHIVPVYGVGTDRGVPYYAMPFVEGGSLQAVIQRLRAGQPISAETPPDAGPATTGPALIQFAARVGRQAADALDHAHALGVLHRDIKPANLLLDDHGETRLTDFGLARFQGETGMTHSGDLIGTLRYMSPEQALGRATDVDGRTDIYALGATLYELVTLRPFLKAQDGQELLRAIDQSEPVAPRRINPDIPVDLETIILKAVAKRPAARYATARALADDLGRFLDDEPIQARRPSPAERFRRWAGRHRAVMLAVAISFLAVLTLALASWRSHERRLDAEHDRDVQAGRLSQAEAAVEFAVRALEQLYLPSEDVAADPATRLAALEEALAVFERFERRNQLPAAVQLRVAEGYGQAGDHHARFGRVSRAEADYRHAVGLLTALTKSDPETLTYRDALSATLNNLGSLLQDAGRPADAQRILHRALLIQEGLVAERPDRSESRRQLAIRLNNLGAVANASGDWDRARAYWTRALGLRRDLRSQSPTDPSARRDEAISLANLGGLDLRREKFSAAESSFREAIQRLEPSKAETASTDDQALLARCYYNLGLSLARRHRFFEAEALALRALEIQKALAEEFPARPELLEDMARSYSSLGHAWNATDRVTAGESAFEQSRSIREALVAAAPETPHYREGLAVVHLELAHLLRDHGRHSESVAAYRRALEQNPDFVVASNDLAWELALQPERSPNEVDQSVDYAMRAVVRRPWVGAYWNTLGLARYRAGDWQEATAALRRSMQLRDGGDGFDWFLLALTFSRQGDHATAREWFDRADRWMRDQCADDADLKLLRSEALRELAQSDEAFRDLEVPAEPPANPTAHPDNLALQHAGAASRPAQQATCRSGQGFGPSGIPASILQRSTLAL